MNLLIFPQYAFPANHAVVNTVYEDLLPSRGHRVHMVRPMGGVRQPQFVKAPWPNGSMVVYPDQPRGTRMENLVRSSRRARWVTRAIGQLHDAPIDAILVRNDLVDAFAAAREARRRGIPLIYQLSSPDAEFMISRGRASKGPAGVYPRVRGFYGLTARRWMSRRAEAVLAISESMRDHLVSADGLDPRRVFSFPMGVLESADAGRDGAETLRRRLNLPADRTIVYSGVLDPVRQPEWMLDVFDLVRARLPDAVLLVVTYQSETDARRHAFEAEGRRRQGDIRVVGPIPFRDVPTYLRSADVMISPYAPMLEHKMASPTKSLEGLCAGLPVVGSAEVDEHPAILEPSGGGVSVPWDKVRFAEAIVSLLQDPERRRRMGDQGRRWVLAHRTYAHLTDYLERILAAAHAPAALRELPHQP